jgi:hypothetical protein
MYLSNVIPTYKDDLPVCTDFEKLAGKRIIRLIACFCRLWAFETVQNALEKEENNAWTNGQSKRKETLMRAYQLATQVILI